MFTIYSKEGCQFCDKLVTFMDQNDLPYTKLMLGEDYDAGDFVDKFGRSTFPRVLHEGELVGGMKETVNFIIKNKLV